MRSVQSLRVEDKFSSSGLVQKHILLPDRNPSLLLNLSERKHRHEHCLLFMEKLSALNTQLSSLPSLSLSLSFFFYYSFKDVAQLIVGKVSAIPPSFPSAVGAGLSSAPDNLCWVVMVISEPSQLTRVVKKHRPTAPSWS